jgi:hypothetical protein
VFSSDLARAAETASEDLAEQDFAWREGWEYLLG